MKRPIATLAALFAAGCTTESVPLFVDAEPRAPDATVFADAEPPRADATPPDAGAPDAEPDAGDPDSGVVRVRVCPTEIPVLGESPFSPRHPTGFVELASAPGWSWVAQSASPGSSSYDYWHRVEGAAPFIDDYGFGLSYSDEAGQPQLAAHGDDAVTAVVPGGDARGHGVSLDVFSDEGSRPRTTFLFPADEQLRDALYTPTALVLALTSSTSAHLVRIHHDARPPGAWLSTDASPSTAPLDIRGFRLAMAEWPIWWSVVLGTDADNTHFVISEQSFDGDQTDSYFSDVFCLPEGPSSPQAILHDVAAGDRDRLWHVTSCGPSMTLTAASRRASLQRLDVPTARTVQAPTQLAYDGLTMTVLEWPVGATQPQLVFFDARQADEIGRATLDFHLPSFAQRLEAMDMTASPSRDGLRTEYTATFTIFERTRQELYTTSVIFEGCRLE